MKNILQLASNYLEMVVFISPLQLSLLLLALSLAFAKNLPTTTDEIILQDGGRGTEIVLRSVVRLRAEAIAESDESQFLRRIAYVETRDGSTAALEEGGIWGVDYTSFRKTQAPDVEELTKLKIAQIEHSFGIEWTSVEWTELSKPLYSAIAAHLVLHLVKPSLLPPHTDVEGQALFWKSHYNTNGSLEAFINAVNQLEGEHSVQGACIPNPADIYLTYIYSGCFIQSYHNGAPFVYLLT